jgi:hypothetical protein
MIERSKSTARSLSPSTTFFPALAARYAALRVRTTAFISAGEHDSPAAILEAQDSAPVRVPAAFTALFNLGI